MSQLKLKCVARSSNLARVQVREIEQELGLVLEPIFIESHGDLDLKTSLRALDKTDFFMVCKLITIDLLYL